MTTQKRVRKAPAKLNLSELRPHPADPDLESLVSGVIVAASIGHALQRPETGIGGDTQHDQAEHGRV